MYTCILKKSFHSPLDRSVIIHIREWYYLKLNECTRSKVPIEKMIMKIGRLLEDIFGRTFEGSEKWFKKNKWISRQLQRVNTNKPVYWNLTLEFRAKRQTRFDPSKFSSRKTIQVRKRIELTKLYRNTGIVSLMTETYYPSF